MDTLGKFFICKETRKVYPLNDKNTVSYNKISK